MDGHRYAAGQVARMPHLSMTAGLSKQHETCTFEGADDSRSVHLDDAAQAALISTVAILVCGSGTSRPSAFNPAT